jgi:hypothetical protein
VAITAKMKEPEVLGVPVIAPPGDMANPGGNAPEATIRLIG